MKQLVKESVYPYPIEVVWAALTNGEALAQWLMPNNFPACAKVGDTFQFRIDPMGPLGGTVECEILELAPPTRMVWSWTGCKASGVKMGPQRVEWELTARGTSTHLRLKQSDVGKMPFFMRLMMSFGWGTMVKRWLPKILVRFEEGTLRYQRLEKAPNSGHHKTKTVPAEFYR
ncbi:MAG: SRPBCC domain-containing protein [Phycisphaeraceae bacterium]|nr:SRPBCC domain-containing protein [Phycisphaeraceae bacterium]